MAFFDTTWYINYGNGSTTGYYGVSVWATLTSYSAGQWVRQAATPTVGNERCFVCVVAGTSLVSEPTWTVTRGAKTAEAAGPTWQECTGMPGPCGDLTNSVVWLTVKNTAVTLGEVIYDSVSGSLQICSTAGTAGNGASPSFSATAGTTTADNTITWTSLGPTSNYTTAFKYPHNRLSNSFTATWGVAGNNFYLSNNSAETRSTSFTLTIPGTSSAPSYAYCVTDTTAPPTTLNTTATISTTGASDISVVGYGYYYGIGFQSGSAANSSSINFINANANTILDTCSLQLNNTNSASRIAIGDGGLTSRGGFLKLLNNTFIFGSTSQAILFRAAAYDAYIIGGSMALTGSIPTTLISNSLNGAGETLILIRDCNMSAVTGTLATAGTGHMMIQNSKLGSGVTLLSGTPNATAGEFRVHNADSANTNYRYYFSLFSGTAQQETTIVRTGSLATNGTTPMSWGIVTTANSYYGFPFISEDISIWNDVIGSTVIVTLYLISNTTLNNNDFWAEAELLGTSNFPLGVLVSSRMTPLATPTALTSDTSTWGGSTNKYKIVLSVTPQIKGPLKVRWYAAKPSATTYVDPYIYLS